MGILGRNRTEQGPGTGSTIIGSDTQLVGDLTLSDSLHVDGRIEGDIRSQADVTLGSSGEVVGEIHARRVLVSGSMDGRIDAERLEIIAGGVVEGNVRVTDLVIEPGGRFNGSSEIRQAEPESVTEVQKKPSKADADPSAEGSASAA